MAVPLPKLSVEDYLAIERKAEYKSEYYKGEMFAMAGGSRNHSRLSLRLASTLLGRLEGQPCEVHGSDMKVQTSPGGLYTYPDVTVTCGQPAFLGGGNEVLVNPKVIFEILSKSTEAKDRGFKFQQYKQIPSLDQYVLVSQSEPLIEVFSRRPSAGWKDYSETRGLDSTLELASLGLTLPLAEIYRDVTFEPEPD